MANGPICALFGDTRWLEVLESIYIFSCIKANLKQFFSILTRMSFHSATISTNFMDHNFILVLQNSSFNFKIQTKYEISMQIWSLYGKNGSSCIFISSEILSIPKILTKLIRRLISSWSTQFSNSGFVKSLQHTESPNHLQIWPGIKVWSWY